MPRERAVALQNTVPKALPQAPPKEQKKKPGASAAPAKPVGLLHLPLSRNDFPAQAEHCTDATARQQADVLLLFKEVAMSTAGRMMHNLHGYFSSVALDTGMPSL